MTEIIKTNIVIAGASYIGLLAALRLTKGHISCVIFDRKSQEETLKNDGKTFALSRFAVEFLDDLGVWSELRALAQPINSIHVFERRNTANLEFKDSSPMGFMCPSHALKKVLLAKLQSLDCKFIYGANWHTIDNDEYGVQVNLENIDPHHDADLMSGTTKTTGLRQGTSIISNLLISAEGRNSSIATYFHIPKIKHDYNQIALTFTIESDVDNHGVAIEDFSSVGTVAVLPMINHKQFSIIWIQSKNIGEKLRSLDNLQLEMLLAKRLEHSLGNIKIISNIWSYPLHLSFLRKCFHKRVVFIGDALHSIHPIAGQGLNLSIGDIGVLGQILENSHKCGLDLGSFVGLQEFSQTRSCKNLEIIGFTHVLNAMFSSRSNCIAATRQKITQLIQSSNFLQNIMKKRAMGYG